MRVLFGLGNPGSEYEGTRHNIGFEVIEAIAEAARVRLSRGHGEFEIAKVGERSDILLVRPMTFMNNSGEAVKDVLREFSLEPHESLTIVDDFDLPLGKLRLRRSGSAGTHNGLASIAWSLASHDFPRLRCGIGSELKPADKSQTANFVLSPFAREERSAVHEMIDRAGRIAMVFGEVHLQKAIETISQQS